MFDLFKRNKEPLHITRQTVFDNESIPAAALDGDLERRVAALEILGRAIEPRVNDLVDIHKKEITVHHANEVARKARIDAESAARISSGTIDAPELNTTNIGEQWVDTFTKNPISGSDCSKVIAGKQLKQTADKANDDRTLAKDVRRLNALLAKEAAQGNYSCEVQSDFFIANIGALIKVMAVQDIKAKVENDIVYMSWKSDD